jgi:hypothetical protein
MPEAIRRRNDGDENAADTGRSYNVSHSTNSRLQARPRSFCTRTPRRTCAGFTSSDVQGDLELYRMTG